MYNAVLNENALESLRTELVGKKVLIVGNSMSMFSDSAHGELVDSFDFVVRLGKGIPPKKFAQYLGTKFDCWFFGTGRAGSWKHLRHVPWKVYTPSQVRTYEPEHDTHLIHLDMWNGEFQVYRDFVVAGTSSWVLDLNQRVNGKQSKRSRCSQGLQAVEFFKNLGVPVTLIGFDFFAGEHVYEFDNRKHPHIPRHQPTTSWHCPLVSKEYDVNPHAFSTDGLMTNEERYIRSCPGVTVIDMPPVDGEQANRLAETLRGVYK